MYTIHIKGVTNLTNNIRKLRLEQNVSQAELAEVLKISRQAISNYEKGLREPKLETWKKLADYFTVPVEYLQGYSNDRIGWRLWEEATGYSRSTIEFQIKKLIEIGKLSDDDNIQKQIGKACEYLDGRGKTDRNAVMYARQGLYDLEYKIHNEYYIDPVKKERNGEKLGELHLSTYKDYDGSLYYDDMNKEVYDKISEIFDKARTELANYLQNNQF